MSITLDLKPEVEEQAAMQAAARGVSLEAYLASVLEQTVLPSHSNHPSETAAGNGTEARDDKRDPILLARVRNVRGKYAHLAITTEELHRERQADRERDVRQHGEEP